MNLQLSKANYKVFITDLEAGKWRLNTNDHKSKIYNVTEQEGIIYNEVKGKNSVLKLELIKINPKN